MDQVGYDTYCKLLDEVVKEMKGIEIKEEIDVTIDINVSSFIPDEYIENNSQKIEVYQNIALCRTDKDIENIMADIEDRYGKMPLEVVNLLKISKIKQMCIKNGVVKILQKSNNIVFNFAPEHFQMDIDDIIKRYKNRVKFSPAKEPYITYTLKNKNNVIKEIEEFLNVDNK